MNTTRTLPTATTTPVTAHDAAGRPARIALIVASVRTDRAGGAIADWAEQAIAQWRPAHPAGPSADAGLEVDVIDLAHHELPHAAGLAPGGGEDTVLTERIERADGFVILTPEYNHSYPASLKHAIDWHYTPWMFKPAAMISYGAHGGALATEHLRGVFAELHVVTARRTVALAAPWESIGQDGTLAVSERTERALAGMLEELSWWASVLADTRRDRPFSR